MYLKFLCLAICLLGAKCQRGWGSNGYNSGYSNSWNSGFSNSNFGNGGSRKQNGFNNGFDNGYDNGYDNGFDNPYGSVKPFGGSGSNTGYKESESSFVTKKPPQEFYSSGSNQNSNIGYETSLNNKKTDNWQSNSYRRKPNEEKSSSIINLPNSSNWNTNNNFNSVSSSDTNNYNSFSPSKTKKPSGSNNNQNSQFENWNSNNNFYDNNKQKEAFSTDYEENSVFPSRNPEKNIKPTSNPFSGSGKFQTTTQKNNKNSKPSKSDSNNSNKSKKPTGNNNWNSNGSSNSGKDKNPTKEQSGSSKQSNLDTSILDELDKNDWYFGKESNYPKPPFKSTLNIDVSELWNFDKNKKKGSQQSYQGTSNNKRRNRQIGFNNEGVQCECVSVHSCKEEDMILTKEDVKYDSRPLEEFMCEDLAKVCCTNPQTEVNIEESNFEDVSELRCGQRRIRENFLGKLPESIAQPGEFPWMLEIINSENCSATLIHHKVALTAAHCVTGVHPNEITLKAGVGYSNDRFSQARRVARIIIHPGFNIEKPRNDIALLITESPFLLTEYVNTVCLPVTNDKWDSSQCLVAGWRSEKIRERTVKVLEKGIVNFLPQVDCQNIMLVTDLWRDYILHDSFVCGLEKTGRRSCMGDEGGFLICPSKKEPDVYLQVGLVSEGMNCDNFGRPGIFTNVLKFLDWINQNFFDLELFDDIDIRSLK